MRGAPVGRMHRIGILFALSILPATAQERAPGPDRFRAVVFRAGACAIEGVPDADTKYAQFREQNVVVTRNGRIVVVCQARNISGWSDRSGQDLVVRTSDDNGRTWSRARMVATHGLQSICPNAAVYDAKADRMHVLYNLFTWDFTKRPRDVRGEMGAQGCRQFQVTSDDGGATWSDPREITGMIGAGGAAAIFGSGEGIQLRQGPRAGRLVVSGGDFRGGKKVLCFYSDDGGTTWNRSRAVPLPEGMKVQSETKVAELPDGTLVLNNRAAGLRRRAFSADGGGTWSEMEPDPALKTVSCNGSLLAVPHPEGKAGAILLCSVPVGPGRTHGTVYVSPDGGKTWPRRKCVVEGAFAYSSLVILPDGGIGLFYESRDHRDISLAVFPMSSLLE